jgi:hypothetical protein
MKATGRQIILLDAICLWFSADAAITTAVVPALTCCIIIIIIKLPFKP